MSKLIEEIIVRLEPYYGENIDNAVAEIDNIIEREVLAAEIRTFKKMRPYMGGDKYSANLINLNKRIKRLEAKFEDLNQ